MANTVSTAALRPEIWQKELYANVIDELYFTKNGLMGEGDNNIVELKNDLKKTKGDTVTFGITAKLSGAGANGDSELEGKEEAIAVYSESIAIDQKRFAVRLTGKLDEQMNSYDMRKDAKDKLVIQLQEFIERQIFLKLGGVGLATINDVNGVVVAADYAWSNTPTAISDTDTGAGYGARYLCADYTNGADSLAATDLLTPQLISRAKRKLQVASNPKVRPLRINGKDYYVLFIHPYQAYDLHTNAVWSQAMREAEMRGKENPIFTGADGIWDGVIVHTHDYVPFLDNTVVGYNFNTAAGGTNYAIDAFRALLCGRQAIGFVKCTNDNGWVEKSFDYDNMIGFSTGLIGGIDKIMFNSKEYGVMAIDTCATAL
jgi:N4-gp56 family major capsid protein